MDKQKYCPLCGELCREENCAFWNALDCRCSVADLPFIADNIEAVESMLNCATDALESIDKHLEFIGKYI